MYIALYTSGVTYPGIEYIDVATGKPNSEYLFRISRKEDIWKKISIRRNPVSVWFAHILTPCLILIVR
jgi:hypothetical protein